MKEVMVAMPDAARWGATSTSTNAAAASIRPLPAAVSATLPPIDAPTSAGLRASSRVRARTTSSIMDSVL